MATPKELRQQITDTRAELQGALHDVHAKWETKPTAGEGEDAWCPKEVAQHVIGADWYFTNMIAQACGAPAMERPKVDAATPATAAASLSRIAAGDDNVLRHVSEGDLSKTWDAGRLGTLTVERMMEIIVSHTNDHIQQLRAAGS